VSTKESNQAGERYRQHDRQIPLQHEGVDSQSGRGGDGAKG
jgi:hypothetical protein